MGAHPTCIARSGCRAWSGSAAPPRKWNDFATLAVIGSESLIALVVGRACEARTMAFGQHSGPPATARQLEELLALFERAGYSSFREARHMYDLTQRQASGRFTRDEADDLIARLAAGDGELDPEGAELAIASSSDAAERAARRAANRQAEAVAALPDEVLADELVRRGWICIPGE